MPSQAVVALLSSKLKFFSTLTMFGLSATAVPVAFVAYTSQHPDDNIFTKAGTQHIKPTLDSIPKFLGEHMSESAEKLRNEYSSKGNNMKDVFTNEPYNNLSNVFVEGENAVKPIYKHIYENRKDINYHLFVLGNSIKSIFVFLPTIIRDTIVYNSETRLSEQLLSVQKVVAMAKNPEFKSFTNELQKLYAKHQTTFDTLTIEDGLAALKIFREIREDEFDQILKKFKSNMQQIESSKKSYANATELLKDVFVGIEDMNKLIETIKSLKTKLNTLKEQIKDKVYENQTEKGEEILKKLEDLLEQLSKSETLTKSH